MEAVQIRV